MSRKTVRAFILFVAFLIPLCITWNFALEDKIGENYIFVFFFEVFVFYIPLAICTIGILLGLISLFFEERIKKRVRVSSISVIAVGCLCSSMAFWFIGASSSQEIAKEKSNIAEQKYQVQNFASIPELSEDPLYNGHIGSNYIAIGNRFAYHTEKNYVCDDDDLFSLEISVYEFENVPRLFFHKLCSNLTDEYFCWRTRIGYYAGKTFTGESNGKEYTYYLSSHEGEKRNYSYFVILVENDNSISLLMLSTYYTDNYSIDVSSIIEKMCSE